MAKNIRTHSRKQKAIALAQGSRFAEAKTLYLQVCETDPRDAEAWFHLGVVNGKLECAAEAIACLQKVIALRPDHALAQYNLGMALRGMGNMEEAVKALREAARLQPLRPEIYISLGYTLLALGLLEEAVTCYRTLSRLSPRDVETLAYLGRTLQATGHLDEAIATYRKGLQIDPGYASVYDNMAGALCIQGKHEEAVANHRRALQLTPNDAVTRSNLLLTLHYMPGQDPGEMLAEHQRWAQIHEPAPAGRPPHLNNRDPERRLRIGYVSSDLRTHSVAFFIEPLLANHDKSAFETFCYSGVPRPDATTQRLRGLATAWRHIDGLADDGVAQMIRDDGIDILVDLAGHTGNHRLQLFARKPAPVQVTYLGYPDTTGLTAIDYRFTDALADPAGQDAFYTEKLVRLPGCFLCYKPLAESPPVAPLPALTTGYVTFGSFNNLAKLNPGVVTLWARLLERVPGARLFIKSPPLTDEVTREYWYGVFEKSGVPRERIELAGQASTQAEHLAMYDRLDVALDTFPYNGTTTTCESLWMGVPVITLAGSTHAGRVGVSLLNNSGLQEWVAETPEQYLALAAQLASDVPRLAARRAGLREHLAASPLCDGVAFARKIDAAYRDMWREWCASTKGNS